MKKTWTAEWTIGEFLDFCGCVLNVMHEINAKTIVERQPFNPWMR